MGSPRTALGSGHGIAQRTGGLPLTTKSIFSMLNHAPYGSYAVDMGQVIVF